MIKLTESLAQFVSEPPFEKIPAAAAAVVRQGFIDTIATMIAGRNEPVVRIVGELVQTKSSAARDSSVLLGPGRAAAQDAALINGTAAHALDFDDVALAGHPSTVLVPALMAEGEASGASGAALMRSYLVGYELWAELISREADPYHQKGWHPTGVFGTLAAAAAIANLRGLSVETARNAIGIAASMAGGLVANFGTMTKPFHAGRAASSGIEAVRLAVAGMTAAADAIEHHAGFLAAISPSGKVDLARSAQPLGHALRILDSGLSVKKYPLCYASHRVIDAVIDIARKENLDVESVQSIHATIGITQRSMLRNHTPVTGLEAKFSLEFAIACALLARKVGLPELSDSFVNRAEVQALMKKVEISTVTTSCHIEPVFSYADRVSIRLNTGKEFDSGDIRFARGNLNFPLCDGELQEKFMGCLRGAEHLNAMTLYAQLASLENISNIRSLAE